MLYLAEVQKRSGGLLGGGRAELRLLACQRSEQSWSAISGEETVPSDEASNFGAGALVLVELTATKQIQRVQEAGRPLVSILQNFSRLQEKFKTQEEEIEQWKQSLTYQSQELNRREMEMEARREQLQQLEEDFEQLEQQRQQIDSTREESNRQREELERNHQELERAWDHLRGEMQRLEERQAEIQQSSVLDSEQIGTVQSLFECFTTSPSPIQSLRDQLTQVLEIFAQHQNLLNQHWQKLEQQRTAAQQLQDEVDRQAQDTHHRWQEWHRAQDSLEQARAELKVQQNALNLKQEYARMLSIQLQSQDDLHQQMYRLSDTSDRFKISQQIDVDFLEKMPIDELSKLVQDLERDLEKLSRFVENQEEELTLKQQEIDVLQAKVQAANDYDRLSLETELADEQDGYQMLNETLVGQRRNLRERESILSQHRSILQRRQGQVDSSSQDNDIDLGPIVSQLEVQRHQQAEELRKLESQIEQMQGAIQQAQGLIGGQTIEQENKRHELKQIEQALLNRRTTLSETWGRVNLYQEMLQPIQDGIDELRRRLEETTAALAQAQEVGDSQVQALAEVRQILGV